VHVGSPALYALSVQVSHVLEFESSHSHTVVRHSPLKHTPSNPHEPCGEHAVASGLLTMTHIESIQTLFLHGEYELVSN
jgi:hypothetical protein